MLPQRSSPIPRYYREFHFRYRGFSAVTAILPLSPLPCSSLVYTNLQAKFLIICGLKSLNAAAASHIVTSRQSVIFFTFQSVTFLYVTDSGDYGVHGRHATMETHRKNLTNASRHVLYRTIRYHQFHRSAYVTPTVKYTLRHRSGWVGEAAACSARDQDWNCHQESNNAELSRTDVLSNATSMWTKT